MSDLYIICRMLCDDGCCKDQEPPPVVLAAVDSLCEELLSRRGRGFDPSPAVTSAVTNVVCMLVFSATYRHGDSELQEVLQYNDGIVQTIASGGLVDIYPWMRVGGHWRKTTTSVLSICLSPSISLNISLPPSGIEPTAKKLYSISSPPTNGC